MPRDDRRPGAEGAGGAGEAGGTGGAARGARGPARLGTVVTKKVAGGAVQRVRVKRLLREAFRRHRALLPAGADVVAVAKEAAVAATFEDVAAELRSVAPELARLAKAGPRPPRGSGR
jgi:ribonuclease P protein component